MTGKNRYFRCFTIGSRQPSPTRATRCAPSLRAPNHPGAKTAFSLVEVTLALGIVSFAIIALIVLLGSSVNQSRTLIFQHQTESAMEALRKYFALSPDGFTVASSLPAADGTPQYFAVYPEDDDDRSIWKVSSNTSEQSAYRMVAGLTKSSTPVPPNPHRVMVRVRLYPAGSGVPGPTEVPQYEGDFIVTR